MRKSIGRIVAGGLVGLAGAVGCGNTFMFNSNNNNQYMGDNSGRKECELEGGLWGMWDHSLESRCLARTSDYGDVCTDSLECDGYCEPIAFGEGYLSHGACSQFEGAFCYPVLTNGTPDFQCVD